MEIVRTSLIPITHQIKASECARLAGKLANELQYSESRAGEAEIVAREIATNSALHARGGSLVLQATRHEKQAWIEFFAWDKGPGIADIAAAMKDGHSTSGSLGHGMGAILRLSNQFAIDSDPVAGTRLYARIFPQKEDPEAPRNNRRALLASGISLPKLGEKKNGDNWTMLRDSDTYTIVVIDGLGHGPQAAEASELAIRVVKENRGLRCDQLLEAIHAALHGTRGAVGAACQINLHNHRLQFAGIGNIRTLYATPEKRHHLVSHNGTLGKQIRNIHLFEHEWQSGSQLIMHSDGLSQRWDAETYFQLSKNHPGLAVAALMNQFQKTGDDCTLVAAREASRGASPSAYLS